MAKSITFPVGERLRLTITVEPERVRNGEWQDVAYLTLHHPTGPRSQDTMIVEQVSGCRMEDVAKNLEALLDLAKLREAQREGEVLESMR